MRRSEELLGTVFSVEAPDGCEDMLERCFSEVRRIERSYSRFRDDSELSALNRSLGSWRAVSAELLWLLERALEYRERTFGAFDVTVKSVLDRLGYDKEYSFIEKPPRRGALTRLRELLPGVAIDRWRGRVKLRREVDLGGMGKGFALDVVAAVLEEAGVQEYFIDAGGDVLARGPSFEVLLEHPDDASRAIGKVRLDGASLAASSSNRRRWGAHHHLIDPRTRLPSSSIKAVFVRAEKGMDADAFATAIHASGFLEGVELAQQAGVAALVVSADDRMYVGDDFPVELFEGPAPAHS